jgi:hypothetical protein
MKLQSTTTDEVQGDTHFKEVLGGNDNNENYLVRDTDFQSLNDSILSV